MRRKQITFLLILLLVTIWSMSTPFRQVSEAQVCALERGCFTDFFNTCMPTPTTLPTVNIHAAGDWYTEELSGHCGAKKCFFFIPCPCGPPRGQRLCTFSEKGRL